MNRENIFIEERELQIARNIAGSVDDEELRNLVGLNSVAVKSAEKFFDNELYQVDSETGLYKIPQIVSDINIADLYVNGAYIDIRVCKKGGKLCIPKKLFETAKPQLFMFVNIDDEMSEASLIGFVRSENIDSDMLSGDVYLIEESLLESFMSIESYLSPVEDEFNTDDEEIFEYIDGELNSAELYEKLVKSKDARIRLNKALVAESVYDNLALTPLAADESVDKNDEEQFSGLLENDTLTENVLDKSVIDDEFDTNVIDSEKLEAIEQLTEVDDSVEDVQNPQDSDDLLYQYTTEASPSGVDIIESLDNEESDDSNELGDIAEAIDNGVSVSEVQSDAAEIDENEEQIDTLFEDQSIGSSSVPKRKKSPLPFILLVTILAAAGAGAWYFYNKNSMPDANAPQTEDINDIVAAPEKKPVQADAMPVETVDINKKVQNKNEGTAISIPVIEQNLDASISVNNLKVSWEVPSGYASNTAAGRYLVKLGKIIQLNLKTELLLLNRQPITNKITVEVKFNKDTKKFEAVKIITSSGETKVDNIILNTVNNALATDISINTDSFAKLRGNPILIIRL